MREENNNPAAVDQSDGSQGMPAAPSGGSQGKAATQNGRPSSRVRVRNVVVMALAALVWLAFDMATKGYFNAFEPGQLVGGPFLGLFDFRLVHNTGAAWGMFGDMTVALGIFSIAVCALIALFVLVFFPTASRGMAFGAGLVIAGGLGNAIDRLTLGYVVDFIETTFIDFPVFNVADIGVTCGMVILVVAWLCASRQDREESL